MTDRAGKSNFQFAAEQRPQLLTADAVVKSKSGMSISDRIITAQRTPGTAGGRPSGGVEVVLAFDFFCAGGGRIGAGRTELAV